MATISPQNTKVPRKPLGKNTRNIEYPINKMNIIIGVRKPQIGHKAIIKLYTFIGEKCYLKNDNTPTRVITGMTLGQ